MDPNDLPIHEALAQHLGPEAAQALLDQVSYSNMPNTVKGMAKLPADPKVESAALVLVEDPSLASALDLEPWAEGQAPDPSMTFWALLTLAARADIDVVDRMTDLLDGQEYCRKLLASIRRAADKHAATSTGGRAATNASRPLSSNIVP